MFTVGNGTKIRFWTDHWCCRTALFQSFQQLFAMTAHRNVTVKEVWDQNFGQGGWNLRFFRAFNDWELDLIGNLLNVLRVTGLLWRMTQSLGRVEETGSLELRKCTACWLTPMTPPSRRSAYGWIEFQPKLLLCLGGYVGEGAYFR